MRAETTSFAEGVCYSVAALERVGVPVTGTSDPVAVYIDNQKPTVSIDNDGPPPLTKETTASFVFSSTDGIYDSHERQLKCSLDGVSVDCSGKQGKPYVVTVETEGKHKFEVKAKDKAGNTSDPATREWQTDWTPPTKVVFSSTPRAQDRSTDASFSFSYDAGDVKKIECFLDEAPLSTCSSPMSFPVSVKRHTFRVRASDQAGNYSDATYEWLVDQQPPEISLGVHPGARSKENPAVFSFTPKDDDRVELVQCKLDPVETDFHACSGGNTGHSSSVGAEGQYTFHVNAKDRAGNSHAVSYTWTVDRTPPSVIIIDSPGPLSNSTTAKFTFNSFDTDVERFECSPAGASFSPCDKDKPFYFDSRGGQGTQKFSVRAVDTAGNEGAPTVYEWVVDTVPPEVSITSPSAMRIFNTRFPQIAGTTEAGSEVIVSIDKMEAGHLVADKGNGYWAMLAGGKDGLSENTHTVSISARDSAKNPSSEPAQTVTFSIDVTPPVTEVVSKPASRHDSRTSEFLFRSNEEKVVFKCQLDDAKVFTPCDARYVIEKLPNGLHKLLVRAEDSAGNLEASPVSYSWTVYVDSPLYPDIVRPVDRTTVDTETPLISGTAVPGGSVIVVIDGVANPPTAVNLDGYWEFRPAGRLSEGVHTLSGETVDTKGTSSDTRSPETSFTVALPKTAGVLSGGACSAAGSGFMGGTAFWSLIALFGAIRRRS